MKKLFVLLILLLFFGRSQATDIEARTGILGGDGWGLQTGAYINFPQSRLFSIQTGLLLHTAGNSFSYGDDWNIDFFVPVYASFHIPLSDKVNLRLNAGAYTGSGELESGSYGGGRYRGKKILCGSELFPELCQ